MMAKRKRIRVFCHGPIALGPHHESGWEDLHFSWKVRPGRPSVMSGFCVESIVDARGEVWLAEQMVEQIGSQWAKDDLSEKRRDLEAVERDGIAVNNWDYRYPTVGVNADSVTRAEAERAMTWALVTRHGLRAPFRFVWQRPKDVVLPTSFLAPEDRPA
jgi:hypothetical protein